MFSFCTDIVKKVRDEVKLDDDDEEDVEPGQNHVFAFYDALTPDEQRALDEDFDSYDVDEVEEAFAIATDHSTMCKQGAISIDPPRSMNWDLKKQPVAQNGANLTKIADIGSRKMHAWRNAGFELYFKGRVALVVLSGGMDSRLGENVPKGVLDIGLLSGKSIFQLYAERIRRLQHLVHRKFKRVSYVPMYIMCNRSNREVVEEFFRENSFFGLREQDVVLFTQPYIPVVDQKGKYLMASKYQIFQQPCGNGGLFQALAEEGMISDMKSRCITCMYICSIDNVLAKVGDPLFLGYSDICKAEAAVKCLEKLVPEETFGVFCSRKHNVQEDIDGDGKLDLTTKLKPAVFEFFEVSDEVKKRRAKSGSLTLEYCAGNMSQYFFKVDFSMRVYPHMKKMWHLIPKSLPYIDLVTGETVKPSPLEKNCYRLEMFLFDALQHSNHVVGLQVPRDEWAQVKNVSGMDSPQTALQAVGRLHQTWVLKGGGEFVENKVASDRDDSKCEISPLVSYEGEDLAGQFLKPIPLPYYLPSQQELKHCSSVPPVQDRRTSIHYLNWDAGLAQRELEAELHGQLGNVMDALLDDAKCEYQGERANMQDALPPTPRDADVDAYVDEMRGAGSPRVTQSGGLRASSPGSPTGARYPSTRAVADATSGRKSLINPE